MIAECSPRFIVLCTLFPLLIHGQNHSQTRLGLNFYAGQIIAHSADIENTAGAVPVGIEAEFSKLLSDSTTREICNCSPTLGFRAGYTDYNNDILGRGGHAALFLHYNLIPGSRFNPYIGGTVGLGFINNPYHEVTNPDNQSYSLPVNAYLRAATGLEVNLTPHSSLNIELGFHHISNGGLAQPNRGINQPALSLGYRFTPRPSALNIKSIKNNKIKNRKGETSLSVFTGGSGNAVDYGEKKRFPVWGAGVIGGLLLNNLNRLTLGLEWHYDGAHQHRIEELNLQGTAHRAALITGHEFVLGKFIFSQQAGIYLYDTARYHDMFYHRWGLSYRHKSNWHAGVSVKAHLNVAEFTAMRIGYYIM